jgi:predicted RNA-binding protein associated with RNAse of E/G family
MTPFEREEDELTNAVNAGEITQKEYQDSMRELRDEVRRMAEDEARNAYDAAIERYR